MFGDDEHAALTQDGLAVVYPANHITEAQEEPVTDPTRRALDANQDGLPDYAGAEATTTVQSALEAIPRPLRLALYLLYAIGGPVLIYLNSKQIIGVEELALWAGIGTVLGITAAGNTNAR